MDIKECERWKRSTIVWCIISLVLFAGMVAFGIQSQDAVDELDQYTTFTDYYFRATAVAMQASDIDEMANSNADLASSYYDTSDFEKVMYYSKLAEDQYNTAAYKYKTAATLYEKAHENAPEEYKELMQKYTEIYESAVKCDNYLHESQEYLYSAANAYAIDQWDYGDTQIEDYNKKIISHDLEIEHYQKIYSEIEALLSSR